MRCLGIGFSLILFAAAVLINLFLPNCVIIFFESGLLLLAGVLLLKK